MAKYSITAVIGVVTEKLAEGIKTAQSKVKKLGDSFNSAMAHPAMQAAGAAGRAIVDFGVEAVKTAGKIDASMNEVFTLLPEMTAKAKDEMTKEMIDLAAKVGKPVEDMTKGIYGALSAGIPKENVFSFMEQASKLSIAGVSSVDDAMSSLTTVLNAYGKKADEAGKISDNLFAIVQGGVTTMPELAKNIGKVSSVASSLGVSFEDLGAMISTVTSKMGKGSTPEAMTRIRTMMNELGKSGSKAAKSFELIAGKSFPEFIKSGGTMAGALTLLQGQAKKTGSRISDLFGSAEAGQAALILTTNGMKKFTKEVEAQHNALGKSDEAFGKVDQGFARMMEKLMVGMDAFKYTVGKALSPVVAVVMPLFLKGLKMVQQLPWDKLGKILGENSKLLEPIMDMIFDLVKELFPLVGPLLKISMSMIMAMLPLLAIAIKLLTALMPVIVWLVDKAAIVFDVFNRLMGWLVKMIGAIGKGKEEFAAAGKEMEGGLKTIGKVALWLVQVFKTIGEFIFGLFETVFVRLKETIAALILFAKEGWVIVGWPFRKLKEAIGEAKEIFKQFLSDVWASIKEGWDKIMAVGDALDQKIYSWFPWVEKYVEAFKKFVKEKIKAIWQSIKDFFKGLWEGAQKIFTDLRNKVMKADGETSKALKYFWSLAESIGTKFISLFKKAAAIVEKLGGGIKWVAEKLGLAGGEASTMNAEVEKLGEEMGKTKEETEEAAKAAEREAEARAKAAEHEARNAEFAGNTAKQLEKQKKDSEAIARHNAEQARAARIKQIQELESVKIAAAKIVKSKVNVKLLQATIGKHKEVNSMAQLYSIIASGKKTPAALIREAAKQQAALNKKGKTYTIKSAKGKTPAQQIKKATAEQKRLNAEAKKNPLINLTQKGMTVKAAITVDPKFANMIAHRLAGIHADTSAIYRRLKGKFVNQ